MYTSRGVYILYIPIYIYIGMGMGNWENEVSFILRYTGEKMVFKNLSSFEILFKHFIEL